MRAGLLSHPAWCPVVFVLFAAVVWLATRVPGAYLDLFEHGHWLGPASDMLAGKVPYRDTFPVHGFLSDGGLDFLLFRFLGPSYLLSLDARQLLGALFHPALFLVGAAATRRPALAALAVPLNLGMSIAVVADRPVLPLLSLAAFVWSIGEERSRARAFVSGLFAALGLLYALEYGTFVLAAELATLGACRLFSPKPAVCPVRGVSFLLGLGIVFVPWFAYLAASGALVPFLRVSFVDLPIRIHAIWGIQFPAPWELLGEWLKGRKYVVEGIAIGPAIAKRFYLDPILGVSGLALAIWLGRRRGSPVLALRLLVLSLACLFFFRAVIARFHLSSGNALAGPVTLVTLLALFELLRGSSIRLGWRWAAGMFAAGTLAAFAMNGPGRLFAVFREAASYARRMEPLPWTVPLTVARGGGVRVPSDQERTLRALLELTSERVPQGTQIFDLSNRPALYFFSKRMNPTRFYQAPMMAPFEDEILRDLGARPPALVFLTSGTWLDAIDGIPNSRRIPRMEMGRRELPRSRESRRHARRAPGGERERRQSAGRASAAARVRSSTSRSISAMNSSSMLGPPIRR